jgi:hypothetical protein
VPSAVLRTRAQMRSCSAIGIPITGPTCAGHGFGPYRSIRGYGVWCPIVCASRGIIPPSPAPALPTCRHGSRQSAKLRRVFYFPWCGLCARFARAATCRYLRPYFLMRIIHLKPQPVVSCLWAIYEAARLRARLGEPVLLPKKERPGLDDVRRWHRAPSEKLKFGDREGEASSRLHLSKSNPCTFRTMR